MITRITVRFVEDEQNIHDALVKSAKNNRRSLNAEMLRAFEFYLKHSSNVQDKVKPAEKEITKRKAR